MTQVWNVPTASGTSGGQSWQNAHDAFEALRTLHAGPSEPTNMVAYMLWFYTTGSTLRQRNSANSAWIDLLIVGASGVASTFDKVSADRGDANVTLTVAGDSGIQRFATTLTANRTVTLSTTGAVNGNRFRIVRTGLGAFTLDVGGLKTIPSATAAFVDVSFNGTAWVLTGYGLL